MRSTLRTGGLVIAGLALLLGIAAFIMTRDPMLIIFSLIVGTVSALVGALAGGVRRPK